VLFGRRAPPDGGRGGWARMGPARRTIARLGRRWPGGPTVGIRVAYYGRLLRSPSGRGRGSLRPSGWRCPGQKWRCWYLVEAAVPAPLRTGTAGRAAGGPAPPVTEPPSRTVGLSCGPIHPRPASYQKWQFWRARTRAPGRRRSLRRLAVAGATQPRPLCCFIHQPGWLRERVDGRVRTMSPPTEHGCGCLPRRVVPSTHGLGI